MKGKLLFKKTFAFLLVFCITFLFSAGDEKKGAKILMDEFLASYKVGGTVYFAGASEGDAGYADEDFFYLMYECDDSRISDFAILISSGGERISECAVFICYSEYDAMEVADMCKRRIELLRSLGGSVDVSSSRDAVVYKKGKTVFMSALADNGRAKRIFERIG